MTSFVLATALILAVLLVALSIFARPGKDGISRIAGHPVLTVLSGSMVPVFRPGDMIIDTAVSPSQAERLAAGDIITFHVPGSSTELITHRIVAVKHAAYGVAYQTKGDANNAKDSELVLPSQVVGTYNRHVPFAGYALNAVRSKTVVFLLIFIPLLYLGGSWFAKRWRDMGSEDRNGTGSTSADTPDDPAEQEPALAFAANPPHAPSSNGFHAEGGAHPL